MSKTNASKQMYLKTILQLRKGGAKVRNIDIAAALGYSKPSVTNAIKKLSADGMVKVAFDNEIILTEEGLETAEKLLEKYEALESLLLDLGAEKSVAEENACLMEHVLTDELYELICTSKTK